MLEPSTMLVAAAGSVAGLFLYWIFAWWKAKTAR